MEVRSLRFMRVWDTQTEPGSLSPGGFLKLVLEDGSASRWRITGLEQIRLEVRA